VPPRHHFVGDDAKRPQVYVFSVPILQEEEGKKEGKKKGRTYMKEGRKEGR
jgi:hypothetical protein